MVVNWEIVYPVALFRKFILIIKILSHELISHGLVVMGRDSGSEGRGFESRHRILDGHFFTYICSKNCIVCLKRPKINEKESGVGPFFKKEAQCLIPTQPKPTSFTFT